MNRILNLQEIKLKTCSADDIFQLLEDMEKNLHPGILRDIATVYLAKIEKKYPNFIEPYTRKILLGNYSGYFSEKNGELPKTEEQILFEMISWCPATCTEREIIAMCGWSALMINSNMVAIQYLSKAHVIHLINTENFDDFIEKAQQNIKYNQAYNNAIEIQTNILKEVAVKQYGYHSK